MEQAYERLRAVSRQAQRPGGGMPGGGRGLMGIGGLIVLAGAAMVAQNSLFNVDGGHRAIKYRRISGVGKDIYNEGMQNKHTMPSRNSFANVYNTQARTSLCLGSRRLLFTMFARSLGVLPP